MGKKQGDRSKRHCMLVHAYYPLGETRVQREALALVSCGYEVEVICLRDVGDDPFGEEEGVKIHRLPMKRHRGRGIHVQLMEYMVFLLLAFWKLAFLHLRKPYGTVQVHNLPDFLVFAALIPKLSGARILLDLHDLMPEFFAGKMGSNVSGWLVRLVTWQEQLSCRFADHVITVTEGWRDTLIKRGVPPEKVSVVMNVADAGIFQRSAQADHPDKNGDRFELIYHGTFTHRYGVDLIIQAVHQLRQQIPAIHATLLGNGESRDELVELIQALGLEKHVDILPFLHVPEMIRYIRQSDVGIVPNRSNIFTDGILPTKLMEYVALGTPVIIARTPTIQAYFDDTMVKYFEPGDVDDLALSILSLYQDRQMLAQIAHNSNRFNLQYNWGKVAARYAGLVDHLNQVDLPQAA